MTQSNIADALNRGIMAPLHRYYPDAGGCNYAYAQINPSDRQQDGNGHPYYYTGPVFGTHNSSVHYGSLMNAKHYNLPLEGKQVDWSDPWLTVLWQINLARAVTHSSTADNLPWLTTKETGGGTFGDVTVAKSPWWQ